MTTEAIVTVPDIGDFEDVEVIEILVSIGDQVVVEQSLITLESDKATMEIPSTAVGVVKEIYVNLGDLISEGARLVGVEVEIDTEPTEPDSATEADEVLVRSEVGLAQEDDDLTMSSDVAGSEEEEPPKGEDRIDGMTLAHASPSVRRLARELGIDLLLVTGSGRKGRVLKSDIEGFVKSELAKKDRQRGSDVASVEVSEVDFSRFGEIEIVTPHKIRRVSARNLHRSWTTVPHVTQFDEADITDLEAFRREKADEAESRGVRLTIVSFLLKACAEALLHFPRVNSSLGPRGESLVLKKYVHIGVAVDTENGLVVPVIRNVDQKGLWDLAAELAEMSARARERKLRPQDLSGACFTISSLGGLGGSSFTPIVNLPEVAILGVSRSRVKPVYLDEKFEPRLILPLSLSYDHRVIDGAEGVRFTTKLGRLLSDLRNLLL